MISTDTKPCCQSRGIFGNAFGMRCDAFKPVPFEKSTDVLTKVICQFGGFFQL